MERAVTQQPADRGGINVVGASHISLRLATGQPAAMPPTADAASSCAVAIQFER
jgi:hypothetical protein